jgi:hypothetical protein
VCVCVCVLRWRAGQVVVVKEVAQVRRWRGHAGNSVVSTFLGAAPVFACFLLCVFCHLG